MAVRLTLPIPFHGMPHLWNLSANVGADRASCPNRPDDVALVKYLIGLNRQWAPAKHPACTNPPMQINDQFDAVLGFWITVYTTAFFPGIIKNLLALVPAQGAEDSAIRLINELAFQLAPDAWAAAPTRFRALDPVVSATVGSPLQGGSRTALRRP